MDREDAEQAPSQKSEDVLREKEFNRGGGLDLGAFMVEQPAVEAETPVEDEVENIRDDAVGDMGELFSMKEEEAPSEVPDSVTSLAVHGEQQLGRGLMVAMVVVWTAIGTLVGTVLSPAISAVGLLGMALVGLYLGERWIRRPSMQLLGITWVIISMKLLYGLALDAWSWGWLDSSPFSANETLGVFLLALVALNVGLAFRHDEDAIAAQAALVLFAVGSSAGAVFGETGIAVFIVVAMALMHGLAWVRSSGNLASLGISISYLWVGVHALSNDWTILSLTLLPIENDLTLFFLLSTVTAANAGMAAYFVHHENWLSQAVEAIGLGKPGLWAVSVSLGMVGALMAIGAHRTETGYALAQLLLLTLAFTASYLVVRGVSWTRLMPIVLAPLPFMLAVLALLDTGTLTLEWPWGLGDYSIFASIAAVLCVTVLLQHQTEVSDHVLWMGSLATVILLTLLIPAEDGGEGARLLLVTQGAVWIGVAGLAVWRQSPSMAGVAVLAPYVWLLIFATDFESRIVSADLLPIVLNEADMGVWLCLLMVQQVAVNSSMGEANLNLAGRLSGFSEISARLRDSKLFNLWNLSFIMACLVFLAVTRPGGLTSTGLYVGMSLLLLAHAGMVWQERHHGQPRTLLVVWSITAVSMAWRFGGEALWAAALTVASFILLLASKRRLVNGADEREMELHQALPGRLLTLHLAVITALFLIVSLSPARTSSLVGQSEWMAGITNLFALTLMGAVSLLMYLQRLTQVEALLPPTVAALGVLISMAMAGQQFESEAVLLTAMALFVGTGSYLAFQGEVRAGLKALAKREEREASYAEKRGRMQALLSSATTTDGETTVELKQLDAQLLDLAEKQRKRSKRSAGGSNDLLVGDIHYQPVLLMLFLGVTFLISCWIAYATTFALMALGFSAAFSVVLVGLARLRANSIGLRLPDLAGVEMPIAIAMIGIVAVHLAGRMTTGVLDGDDATHLAIMMGTLLLLAGMGLMGRHDLGLRIPSALEAVLGLLVLDRLATLLVGGEVPIPFITDPFAGETLEWTAPILVVELLLFAMVAAFDWVEGERLRRDLPDHRTAAGRSAWVAGASVLTLGPAGGLAILFAMRRSLAWSQPAVMLTAVLSLPLMLQSFTPWVFEPAGLEITPTLTAGLVGLASVVWAGGVVIRDQGLWLSSALWAVHILLYPAALMSQSLVWLTLAGLIASTTAWLCGIITLRKSWRVIGAVDLLVAWMFAAAAVIAGTSALYALVMLIASAVLLFAVTALSQANEADMAAQ